VTIVLVLAGPGAAGLTRVAGVRALPAAAVVIAAALSSTGRRALVSPQVTGSAVIGTAAINPGVISSSVVGPGIVGPGIVSRSVAGPRVAGASVVRGVGIGNSGVPAVPEPCVVSGAG
jgi:hypothetical protein